MLDKYIKNNRKNIKVGLIIGIIIFLISLILFALKIKGAATIFFIFSILTIITIIFDRYKLIEKEKSLTEEEKKRIESELNKTTFVSKNHYIITDNGIFIPNKLEFINYNEILCIYERPKFSRYSLDINIHIITKNNDLCLPTYTTALTIGFTYYDLKEIITKNNPQVLIGKTKENKKILKEKYQINL